ncbi:MAG: aminotransferase class III-fold pyridoxal phosphate-dependent enzyme [Evtepia gabavorous]
MSKYPEYQHTKSRAWFDRALQVIPSGVYGHLGPSEGLFLPLEKWPLLSSKAKGAYFWDLDGNPYLDLMCAYGPNVLGYGDPDVDRAAMEQLMAGNCTTAPSYKMVECAELLVDTVAMADWAFFMKTAPTPPPSPSSPPGPSQGRRRPCSSGATPRQRPLGHESRLPRCPAGGGSQQPCGTLVRPARYGGGL